MIYQNGAHENLAKYEEKPCTTYFSGKFRNPDTKKNGFSGLHSSTILLSNRFKVCSGKNLLYLESLKIMTSALT